jgi:hypothetical protein
MSFEFLFNSSYQSSSIMGACGGEFPYHYYK